MENKKLGSIEFNFKNKIVIITGGANGMGFACAKLFSMHGADVWIFDLEKEKPQEVANEIQVNGISVNVTDRSALENAFNQVGKFDIVVANAEGDFILWVDGDMTISSDFVRKLVGFMDQHCEAGIAKGKQALKPGANLLATLETYARAASRMVNYKSKTASLKTLGTGGAIYRIEALREAGPICRCLWWLELL